MKSILELFKQGMGPSSTLNMVPYRACLDIAREIRLKRSKINHVEVYLYNEFGEPGMATMGYYLYYWTVDISSKASQPIGVPYGFPAALGICISLVSIPIVLLGRKILNKIIPTVEV